MTIRVLFFGATADSVGRRSDEMSLTAEMTTREVLAKLIDEFPALSRMKLHVSLNQEYASGKEIVKDGDEIAVFTAVSGG
ncbi:MAG: MoaD/ThiS family protein [Acidobacteria bacterium]|nr:MoaD/ThiS family protein [Acidobacteriota bacterium]